MTKGQAMISALLRLLLVATALAPGSCFLLHRPPANQLRRWTPMRMTAGAAPPVYVIFVERVFVVVTAALATLVAELLAAHLPRHHRGG